MANKNTKKTINKKITSKPLVKKTKTLNKGLEEIFGGDVQQVIDNITEKRTNGDLFDIPITNLVPNPFQPRKNFDNKELNGLADSIKNNGLFTPILVKENEAGEYYIVAGERRSKAAKLAGLKTIKGIIAKLSDSEMQRIALIENVQREDLNPIEVASSLSHMVKNQNLKHEEVAQIIAKSRSYVGNMLGLLKLDKKIIDGVLKGKISYGHARPLISLETIDAKNIYNQIIEQNLSVREVEGYAKAAKSRQARRNKSHNTIKRNKELEYAEQLLRNKLKTKIILDHKQIIIKYKDKDHLNRILERIGAIEK